MKRIGATLLVALCIASSLAIGSALEETDNFWLDAQYGTDNGNGSLGAPFRTVLQFSNWLSNSALQSSKVALFIAPGIYQDPVIRNVRHNISFLPCISCSSEHYDVSTILFDLQADLPFLYTFAASQLTITMDNIVFAGQNAQDMRSSIVIGLEPFIRLEMSNVTIEHFVSASPFISANSNSVFHGKNMIVRNNTLTTRYTNGYVASSGLFFSGQVQSDLFIQYSEFEFNTVYSDDPSRSSKWPPFQGAIIDTEGEAHFFGAQFRQNGFLLDLNMPYFLNTPSQSVCGGAIALTGSFNTIRESQFESNFILINGTNDNTTRGGALCLGQATVTQIENSSFRRNLAGSGAAIASALPGSNTEVLDVPPANSLVIVSSDFTSNVCNLRGCAIFFAPLLYPGYLEIESSDFSSNTLSTDYKCPAAKKPHLGSDHPFSDAMARLIPNGGQIRETFKNLKIIDTSSDFPKNSHYNNKTDQRSGGNLFFEKRRTFFDFAPKSRRPTKDSSTTTQGSSNTPLIGGAAIAVMSDQHYFSYPTKTIVALGAVTFSKNSLSVICNGPNLPNPYGEGAALLMNQVTSVAMENIVFSDHSLNSSSSLVSMRQITRLLAKDITFKRNKLLWDADRRKNTLWDIQSQGFMSDSPTPEMGLYTQIQRKNSDRAKGGLFEMILNRFGDHKAQKAAYVIENLQLSENTVRDTYFHCAGAHSILLSGCKWQKFHLPKHFWVPLKTSIVLIRKVVRHVYIEDTVVDEVETPIDVAYVGGAMLVSNSNFSRFSGSQSAFVNIHQVNSFQVTGSTFESNQATALAVSSSTFSLLRSTFFNNSSPAYAGGIRVTDSRTSIFVSNFTYNMGLNGGAISTDASLQILNTYLAFNSAFQNGGAIVAISSSSVSLDSVHCVNNTASSAGGCIFYRGDQPELANSLSLTGNWHVKDAHERIKALQISHRKSFVSQETLFAFNRASTGGAVSLNGGVNSRFSTSIFEDNFAFQHAGAVEIWEPLLFSGISGLAPLLLPIQVVSTHFMVQCRFSDNYAGAFKQKDLSHQQSKQNRPNPLGLTTPSFIGGAIMVHQAKLDIQDSAFLRNAAESHGGAIYALNSLRAGLTIQGTHFTDNWGIISGGALAIAEQPVSPAIPGNLACHVQLQDVVFDSNFAAFGGAFSWSPSWNCSDNQLGGSSAYLKNVEFKTNKALESGGAVFAVFETISQFYSYDNISLKENTAIISGEHFFFHYVPKDEVDPRESQKPVPPTFCDPGLCTVVKQPSRDRTSWGPIQASSFWELVYDLTPLSGVLMVQPFSLPYRLYDLYHQRVTEPLTLSAQISTYCSNQPTQNSAPDDFETAAEDPASGLIFNGFTKVELLLTPGVSGKFARDPFESFRQNQTNPFVAPVDVSVLVELVPISYEYDRFAFLRSVQVINTKVYRCPEGFGLWKLPGDEALFGCLSCPIGTYNFNGDGQCYSCHHETATLNCQADTVSASAGFWTFKPESISDAPYSTDQNATEPAIDTITNELFIAKCRTGQCLTGTCASGRTGIMCGDCDSGTWETLFSHCSSSLCPYPPPAFFIVVPLCSLCALFLFHFFVNRMPIFTMHFSAFLVIGVMLMQASLDWALPQAFPKLSAFLCGFRANAIQRVLFFSFGPYLAIPVLGLAWLILQVPLRLKFGQKFATFVVIANEFSGLKILKSICGLLIILSVPSLKYGLDWTQCTETPSLGNRWIFAPSVLCASEAFKSARLLSLLILTPISILPIALSCVAIRLELLTAKKSRNVTLLAPVSQLLINPLSSVSSRVGSMIDLVGKVVIGIVLALLATETDTRALIVSGILIILMMINAIISPFLTTVERLSSTLSYGILAVFAVAEPTFFGRSSYSIIAVSVFLTWMILNLVVIVIYSKGRLAAEIDGQWQQVSQRESTNNAETESFQ
jgi:hypothetical protein